MSARERLEASKEARRTGHPATCECKGSGLIPVSGFTSGYAACPRFTITLPPDPEVARLRSRVAEVIEEAAEIAEEPSAFVEDRDQIKERRLKAKRIRALASPSETRPQRCPGCGWTAGHDRRCAIAGDDAAPSETRPEPKARPNCDDCFAGPGEPHHPKCAYAAPSETREPEGTP